MPNPFSGELYDLISITESNSSVIFRDFTGTFFANSSFPAVPKVEHVGDIVPGEVGDGFRAGPAEWGAFALGVALVDQKKISPCLVELGCSQGLWCFPWINVLKRLNISKVTALGVEAADAFEEVLDFWNLQARSFNVSKNQDSILIYGTDWKFKWLHGAVTLSSKWVEFPDVSVATNNGASINNSMLHDVKKMISVQPIHPERILSEMQMELGETKIGVLHLDLQGEEMQLIHSDIFLDLLRRTSILVLGTHSTEVESEAIPIISKLGFTLISIDFSDYSSGQPQRLVKDGEQVWLSNDIIEHCVEQKFIKPSETIETLSNTLLELLSMRKDSFVEQNSIHRDDLDQSLQQIDLKQNRRFLGIIGRIRAHF